MRRSRLPREGGPPSYPSRRRRSNSGEASYEYTGNDGETFPKQLYIEPEECIDCGVCGPECPWEAIFEGEQVPSVFEEDTALNAKMLECKDAFRVPEVEDKPPPTPEQIAANKQKWGYAG